MSGDGATPGAEDFEYLRLPLPDPPPLGPRGTWASEHPLTALAMPLAGNLWFVGYLVSARSPFGIVYVFGTYLAVLFAISAVHVLLRRVAAARSRRLRDEFPSEPWRYEHDWDERGESRTWGVRMAEAARAGHARFRFPVAAIYGLAAGLASARWWTPLAFVAGIVVTGVLWWTWRLHGAGDSHLWFAKFPFHPGERVTLRFGMGPGGATFQRAEFRLCRVSELALSRRVAPHAGVRTRTLCERRPPGELPGSDFDVEVSFDVPANAGGTKLSGSPPEYWVLDVLAATTSGPYAESFLIPIYERPSAPPDAQAPA